MLVTPEQWPALSRLLDEALGLEPVARARWLAALPPADAGLGEALRALLASHAAIETSDFLDVLPRLDVPPGTAGGGAAGNALAPGTAIGGYVIEAEAGRGGMSVVYRARRADGLFRRSVALKLLHASDFSSESRERFARERDILSGLTHPNIARLYDAGTTESGQPFIALEFVDGLPLTTYCDRRRLGIRDRLRLMLQVLHAVQFAHANLVIHRDLKPSNIFVTADGEVRLLDFGIAKELLGGAGHVTELTQRSGRALTPDYASPEQILGAPVSTASDVYSLGVVTYELLCGARPYRLTRASAAALEEAVLGAEPIRPSRAQISTAAAEARATTPYRLARLLADDLDTVVLKALKKNQAERYASADAFAQDLDRYLAGQTVLARPDSAWYRARRFVSRNKLGVATAAAVLLALSAGLVVAVSQARRAEVAADTATKERNHARATQEFLLNIFRANSSRQADPQHGRQLTARELLDIGSARIDEQLAQVPQVQEEVYSTLAELYRDVGQPERAAAIAEKRYVLARHLHGDRSPEAARALLDRAVAVSGYDLAAVDPLVDQAMPILEQLHLAGSADYGLALYLKSAAATPQSVEKSLALGERAIAVLRASGDRDERATGLLANALAVQGWTLYARGQFGDAEAHLRDAIQIYTQLFGPDSYERAQATNRIAQIQFAAGEFAAAERNFRDGFELTRKLASADDRDLYFAELAWAQFLLRTGQLAEGREHLEHAIAGNRRIGLATTDAQTVLGSGALMAGAIEESVRILDGANEEYRRAKSAYMPPTELVAFDDIALGRYRQAQQVLDDAWSTLASQGMQNNRRGFNVLLFRALLLDATGRGHDALAAIQQASDLPIDRTRAPELDWRLAMRRAEAYQQLGDLPAALRESGAVVAELRGRPDAGYFPVINSEALLLHGKALRRSGDDRAALPLLEQAVGIYERTQVPASPWLADARVALAECRLDLGDAPGARSLYQRAQDAARTHAELGEHFREPLRALGRRLSGADRRSLPAG